MSGALAKTIKKKSTDGIFVEVLHTENLGLCMPEQLRLFHLALRNNKFYSGDLETMLYRNIGRYVFSRAKLEDFRLEDDLDSVTAQALRIMRENGAADTKGCGNELGEMLVYTFLEDMLGAPKLLSYVERCIAYHSKTQNKELLLEKTQNGILDEDVENYISELTYEEVCKFLVDKQPGFSTILLEYMKQGDTQANDTIQGIESCFREVCHRFSDNDPIATFAYNVLLSDAFGFVVKELAANMLRYVAVDVNRFYAQGLVEDIKEHGLEPMLEDILA